MHKFSIVFVFFFVCLFVNATTLSNGWRNYRAGEHRRELIAECCNKKRFNRDLANLALAGTKSAEVYHSNIQSEHLLSRDKFRLMSFSYDVFNGPMLSHLPNLDEVFYTVAKYICKK